MDYIKIWNPYLLQIHLLDNCIMNCEYCYLWKKSWRHIPVNSIIDFLENLFLNTKNYWISFNLNITWWDLWLYEQYDDIKKFFDYLCEKDEIWHISLLINNLWNKKSKQWINIIDKKVKWIQINTDCIDNRMWDIEYLLNKWYDLYFKVMLSKNNDIEKQISIIHNIFQYFNNNPHLYISIDRLCPFSLGQKQYLLDPKSLELHLRNIKEKFWNQFISEDPFVNVYLWKYKDKNISDNSWDLYWCAIPSWWLSIFPDWSIRLCSRSFYIPTWFTLENFDLINFIKKFSVDKNKYSKCKQCDVFRRCQWWCPAVWYIRNKNDFLTKDYQCFLYK